MRDEHRTRRGFLRLAGSAVGILAIGGRATDVLADAVAGDAPYGPLGRPDRHGVRVPVGFTSRLVARTGEPVGSTGHRWHDAPDGGGCIPAADGGFHYVSNSELADEKGGAGCITFGPDGDIVSARTVLSDTSRNCSGGVTPWGTWLSCEESGPEGRVFECSPTSGPSDARFRPALGLFNHEAVEVVESTRQLYLTEDHPDGRLYRFTPTSWPDLTDGRLECAAVGAGGRVTWIEVSDAEPARDEATTAFKGGEGLAHHENSLFVSTKGDRRVWRYDMASSTIEILHDCRAQPNTALDSVDNLEIDRWSGDLLIAEDGPSLHLCILSTDGATATMSRLAEFVGHDGSEVAGPSFSPDGRTLIVSSQRGRDGRGMTFAITGPFRGRPWSPVSPNSTSRPVSSRLSRGADLSGLASARRM